MKLICTALLTVLAIISEAAEESAADGVFHLISQNYDVVRSDNGIITDLIYTTGPTYAVLELSGESPYDHSDVASLTITSAGSEVLGYEGKYDGNFDESHGSLVEDRDGLLVWSATDLGGGVISLGASFIDNDPPTLDNEAVQERFLLRGGPALTGNLYLEDSVAATDLNPHNQLGVRVRDVSSGPRTVWGRWVRTVPEPSTFVLLAFTLPCAIGRRRFMFRVRPH